MKNLLLPITVVIACLFTITSAKATYGIQTKTKDCIANQTLPDRACSPGAVLTTNTKVTCKPGYTKTVRNVSLAVRKQVFAEYGIAYGLSGNYEVDHIISLELGGSNDIANLFPESYDIQGGAKTKDKFENYLHSQVCRGKLTITTAQREIATDWLKYYNLAFPKPTTTVSVLKTYNG